MANGSNSPAGGAVAGGALRFAGRHPNAAAAADAGPATFTDPDPENLWLMIQPKTGESIADVGPYGYTVTDNTTGMTTTDAIAVGYESIEFDGSNDYLVVTGHPTGTDVIWDADWTVQITWVCDTTSQTPCYWNHQNSSSPTPGNYMSVVHNVNMTRFDVQPGHTDYGLVMPVGKLVNLTITYTASGTLIEWWLNGISQGAVSWGANVVTSVDNDTMHIGTVRAPGSAHLNGRIAEFIVHTSKLDGAVVGRRNLPWARPA